MLFFWIICLCRLAGDHCCEGSCYYILCVACIANPITSSIQVNCYHFYEMMTWLTIVTIIGFAKELPDDYYDGCDICVDDDDRYATNNPYTSGFIYIAWVSFVLDFVLFCVLYKKEVILTGKGDEDDLEDLFQVFKDGQNYIPGVDNQPVDNEKSKDEREKNGVELQVKQQIETNAAVEP